jgi:hypothetical protein
MPITCFLLLRLILAVIFRDRRTSLIRIGIYPLRAWTNKSKISLNLHNDEISLPDHLLTQGIESLTIRFLTASGSGFA